MRVIPLLLVFVIAGSLGWAADPPLGRDAKKELQSMQGSWRLIESESSFATDGVIKRYLPDYKKELQSLNMEGNKLTLHMRRDPLVVANDLQIENVRDHVKGNRLICFTFGDGRAMLGSYKVVGDKVEIRVPETCICTRTGIIASFARVKK